jgi:hypothetical protein
MFNIPFQNLKNGKYVIRYYTYFCIDPLNQLKNLNLKDRQFRIIYIFKYIAVPRQMCSDYLSLGCNNLDSDVY